MESATLTSDWSVLGQRTTTVLLKPSHVSYTAHVRTYDEATPLRSSCHVVSCYSNVCTDLTIAGFYALDLFLPTHAYSILYVVVGVKGHCLRGCTVVQHSLAGTTYTVCHRTSSISR